MINFSLKNAFVAVMSSQSPGGHIGVGAPGCRWVINTPARNSDPGTVICVIRYAKVFRIPATFMSPSDRHSTNSYLSLGVCVLLCWPVFDFCFWVCLLFFFLSFFLFRYQMINVSGNVKAQGEKPRHCRRSWHKLEEPGRAGIEWGCVRSFCEA